MADIQVLAFLHSHGLNLSPKLLYEMLEEAIEQLPSISFLRDPRRELTPAEANELDEAGFDLSSRDLGKQDPLARSVALYAGMLAKSLSVKEAAFRLGVNQSRIRQRLTKERSLYGIKIRKEWRIPTFQFEADTLIPGIEQVVASLSPALNPVAVLSWFTTSNPNLQIESQDPSKPGLLPSPRDWLLAGHNPQVVSDLACDL